VLDSEAQPRARPARTEPRRPFTAGWLLGTLLAYHVLFLAGAGALVFGFARNSPIGMYVGLALIVVGIAAQQFVLRRSADLATRGTPFTVGSLGRGAQSRTPDPRGPWLCPGCGWRGVQGAGSCPRCGKFLVRL